MTSAPPSPPSGCDADDGDYDHDHDHDRDRDGADAPRAGGPRPVRPVPPRPEAEAEAEAQAEAETGPPDVAHDAEGVASTVGAGEGAGATRSRSRSPPPPHAPPTDGDDGDDGAHYHAAPPPPGEDGCIVSGVAEGVSVAVAAASAGIDVDGDGGRGVIGVGESDDRRPSSSPVDSSSSDGGSAASSGGLGDGGGGGGDCGDEADGDGEAMSDGGGGGGGGSSEVLASSSSSICSTSSSSSSPSSSCDEGEGQGEGEGEGGGLPEGGGESVGSTMAPPPAPHRTHEAANGAAVARAVRVAPGVTARIIVHCADATDDAGSGADFDDAKTGDGDACLRRRRWCVEVELTGPGAGVAIRGRCGGGDGRRGPRPGPGHHRRRGSSSSSSGRARLRVLRGAVSVLGYTIAVDGGRDGGDGGTKTGDDGAASGSTSDLSDRGGGIREAGAALYSGGGVSATGEWAGGLPGPGRGRAPRHGDDEVTIDSPPFLSSLVVSNNAAAHDATAASAKPEADRHDIDLNLNGRQHRGNDDADKRDGDVIAAVTPPPPPVVSTMLIWNADDDDEEVDADDDGTGAASSSSSRKRRRPHGHHHRRRPVSSNGKKKKKKKKKRRRNGEKNKMGAADGSRCGQLRGADDSPYGEGEGGGCCHDHMCQRHERHHFFRSLDRLFDFDLIDPTTGRLPRYCGGGRLDLGDADGSGNGNGRAAGANGGAVVSHGHPAVPVVRIPPGWERAMDAVVSDDRNSRRPRHRDPHRDDGGGRRGGDDDDREREGGVDREGVWRDAQWWHRELRRRRHRRMQAPSPPRPPRPPRVLICGAQGVGKSTMLRYAVNRLLSSSSSIAAADGECGGRPVDDDRQGAATAPKPVAPPAPRVMVLDCDAGQPELSPPGILSLTAVSGPLLSSPHSHMVVKRRRGPAGAGAGSGAPAPGDAGGGGDVGDGAMVAGTKTGGVGCHGDGGVGCSDDRSHSGWAAADGHEMAYYYGYLTSRADPVRYLRMVGDLVAAYDDEIEEYEYKSSRWHGEGARIRASDAEGDDRGDTDDGGGGTNDGESTNTDDSRAPPWPPPPHPPPPLVVNTDGWVKSMGADVLGAVIDAVRPDHVVQIVGFTRSKRFDLSRVLPAGAYAAAASPPPSDPTVGAACDGVGGGVGGTAAGLPMLHVVDSFGVAETAAAAREAEVAVSAPVPHRREDDFDEGVGGNIRVRGRNSAPPGHPVTAEGDAGGPGPEAAYRYGPRAMGPPLECDGNNADELETSPDRRCPEAADADVNALPAASPSRPAVVVDPVPHPSSPPSPPFPLFTRPPSVSSAHLRSLRLCCYFLGGFQNCTLLGAHFDPRRGGIVDTDHAMARALAAEAPHAVPLDAVRCVVLGEEGEAPGRSTGLLLDVLNGSVVGLCVSGRGGTRASSPSPHCPSHGPCVGLGIVRAIDHRSREGGWHGTTSSTSTTTATTTLFVLTPVGSDTLRHVDTLVLGRVTLPVECGYRGGAYSESCPFYNQRQD